MAEHGSRVGVIGCGVISTAYLRRLAALDDIEVVACADSFVDRASDQAKAFDVPVACTPDELIDRPDIDVILNLTPPGAHEAISSAALEAGKNLYSEKPLALTRAAGLRLVEEARAHGLRLGSAPDTFLGAGLQTCRALIDEGAIGEPLAASAFTGTSGPESWHPNPGFFYEIGAGPLFDMGPYYLTALVSLLGAAKRVTGSARISRPVRTITSDPLRGSTIAVQVPTHVAAIIDLTAGPVITLVTSFDVQASDLPCMEIYGSEGTLSVPNPNTFGGPVRLRRNRKEEWCEQPLKAGFSEQERGIGLYEMVLAERAGRPHRASGELALHTIDIMEAICDASSGGVAVELSTRCERPAPLLPGWDTNECSVGAG